jgi:DnaK suppressor protein
LRGGVDLPRSKSTSKKSSKKTSKRKASAKSSSKPGRKTGGRKGASKAAGKPARKKVARKKAAGKPARKKVARKKPAGKAGTRKTTARKARKRTLSRVDELRAMLEKRRAEIVAEIKRAREDSVAVDHSSFSEVGDQVSASVEKERAFEYGELGVQELREIDMALHRLNEGTYGICEMCDKPITVKRLRVVPSARLCIKCKSREEASGGPR